MITSNTRQTVFPVQEAEIRPGSRPLPRRLSRAGPNPQRDVLHPPQSGSVVSNKPKKTQNPSRIHKMGDFYRTNISFRVSWNAFSSYTILFQMRVWCDVWQSRCRFCHYCMWRGGKRVLKKLFFFRFFFLICRVIRILFQQISVPASNIHIGRAPVIITLTLVADAKNGKENAAFWCSVWALPIVTFWIRSPCCPASPSPRAAWTTPWCRSSSWPRWKVSRLSRQGGARDLPPGRPSASRVFFLWTGNMLLSAIFLALATYQSLYPLTLCVGAVLYLMQVSSFTPAD